MSTIGYKQTCSLLYLKCCHYNMLFSYSWQFIDVDDCMHPYLPVVDEHGGGSGHHILTTCTAWYNGGKEHLCRSRLRFMEHQFFRIVMYITDRYRGEVIKQVVTVSGRPNMHCINVPTCLLNMLCLEKQCSLVH